MATELNLVDQPEREREPPKTEDVSAAAPPPVSVEPFNPEREREQARGDLARGLLLLLSFAVGGVLLFVGMGRLEGSVLAQSIFPSLIALAGTALGFYFGSQSPSGAARTPPTTPDGGSPPAGPTVVVQPSPPVQPQPGPEQPPVQPPPVQPPVQPPPEAPPVQPPPMEPPVQPPPVQPPVQPPPVEPPIQPPPDQPQDEGE